MRACVSVYSRVFRVIRVSSTLLFHCCFVCVSVPVAVFDKVYLRLQSAAYQHEADELRSSQGQQAAELRRVLADVQRENSVLKSRIEPLSHENEAARQVCVLSILLLSP